MEESRVFGESRQRDNSPTKKTGFSPMVETGLSASLQRSTTPNETTRKSPSKKYTAKKERNTKSGKTFDSIGLERQNSALSESRLHIKREKSKEVVSDSEAVINEARRMSVKRIEDETKNSYSLPKINDANKVSFNIKLDHLLESNQNMFKDDDRVSG